jgi:mRNA interferase RelE/StbE
MTNFKIQFKRTAHKDLKKLEKTLIKRIMKGIEDLIDNPISRNSKKLKGVENIYRI